MTSPQPPAFEDKELVERQAWFMRNADRRRAGAFINIDPEYFASECADAIMNGTLAALPQPNDRFEDGHD